jgi:nucleoside-diphosphate-sugar epimerase
MNIAITGGNGFIGSNLTNMISIMGHDVILISRKRDPANKNSYSFDDFFNYNINLDISCFIHLASPNYDYSRDSSLTEGITNLTTKILKTLSNYNCKKFIFFSSAKIYGEPSLESTIFSEESKPEPVSDYGKEKLNAENKIVAHAKKHNLDYIIYRLPMVYGSNKNSNIDKLFKLINKSFPLILFKNSNHLQKSLISIENVKLYIKLNIEDINTINKDILNITDKKAISLNDLVSNYKTITNSKSFILFLPFSFLKVLVKVPVIKSIVLKLYGGFKIQNTKINNIHNVNITDTIEQLSSDLSLS